MLSQSTRLRINRMRRAFLHRLPAGQQELLRFTEALRTSEENDTALAGMRQLAQRLAGAGACYELDSISAAAADLESSLAAYVDDATRYRLNAIIERSAKLGALLDQQAIFDLTVEALTSPPSQASLDLQFPYRKLTVLLIGADHGRTDQLAEILESRGYVVTVYHSTDSIQRAINDIQPAVVIIDVVVISDNPLDFSIAGDLVRRLGYHPCLAFISDRDDHQLRMRAADYGADAFFSRPINLRNLTSALDMMLQSHANYDSRVLLVADDADQTDYLQVVLEDQGMQVAVVDEPDELSNIMLEFKPELVLLDVDPPAYSGYSLIRLIRLHEAYFNIPVVALSHRNEPAILMRSMEAGADDFVIKSAGTNVLVKTLQGRVARYRRANNMIIMDSLTGTLNREACLDRVGEELMLAQRRREQAVLAMIDVDDFKQINDTYGHIVGDVVLRNVADILKARLRRSDVTGRYAGDEFIVFMPATGIEDAYHVLNEIGSHLYDRPLKINKTQLHVSLSIGITRIDPTRSTSLDNYLDEADRYLYEAKQNGKNRIEAAARRE